MNETYNEFSLCQWMQAGEAGTRMNEAYNEFPEDMIRDLFLYYNGRLSTARLNKWINRRGFYGPYGRLSGEPKDTLKKAFTKLRKSGNLRKVGRYWLWAFNPLTGSFRSWAFEETV